jgi:TPR repeat protein
MKILFLAVLFVCIGGCVAAPKRTSIGHSPEEIAEYRVGAEKGDAEFQRKLATAYEYGRGVPKNYVTAVEWYTKAAEQGDTYAENSVGDAYYHGRGVPQDYTTAVKWYTKSLEQNPGFILAPYTEVRLGDMYSNGLGVPQDYATAKTLYVKAAVHVSHARVALGNLYYLGDGVPQNNILAYMWFDLAITQGSEKTSIAKDAMKRRSSVTKKMVPTQIAEAQKLSRECLAKAYKDCG